MSCPLVVSLISTGAPPFTGTRHSAPLAPPDGKEQFTARFRSSEARVGFRSPSAVHVVP